MPDVHEPVLIDEKSDSLEGEQGREEGTEEEEWRREAEEAEWEAAMQGDEEAERDIHSRGEGGNSTEQARGSNAAAEQGGGWSENEEKRTSAKRFQARSDANQESRCPIAHPLEPRAVSWRLLRSRDRHMWLVVVDSRCNCGRRWTRVTPPTNVEPLGIAHTPGEGRHVRLHGHMYTGMYRRTQACTTIHGSV